MRLADRCHRTWLRGRHHRSPSRASSPCLDRVRSSSRAWLRAARRGCLPRGEPQRVQRLAMPVRHGPCVRPARRWRQRLRHWSSRSPIAAGLAVPNNAASPRWPLRRCLRSDVADGAAVWRRGSAITFWLDRNAAKLSEWPCEAAIPQAVSVATPAAARRARFGSRQDHTIVRQFLAAMGWGGRGLVELGSSS
jgi:hypothetical protein